MIKKSLKKGMVKKVEREGFRVVLLGPLNKNTGYYMEKVVSLHCLEPAEGYEKEAFEFLRNAIVGKEVEFNDYDLGDRTAADIFVDKYNVGYLMAKEGLIRYFQSGQKTSANYNDLVEGDKEAQQAKKGQYAELTDEQLKKRKRKHKKPLLEDVLGKEVHGYVDELNYKLDFQVYVVELEDVVQASFAGVSIPGVSKEHATHLRNYCAKHVFQRLRPLRLKQVVNEGTGEAVILMTELNNTDEDSVLKNLFAHGYCRLEKEAGSKLELVELMALKALQDQGMATGKGLWKDYKGKIAQPEKKADTNAEMAKLLKTPEFDAKVVAVHSGDTLSIETPTNQILRVTFTNLKAKGMGNPTRDEDPQPWAFEAKELLRKRVMGKTVKVKIDNIRNVVTEDRTFDIINVTLTLDNAPVALELVEEGLLALMPPRLADPSSAALVSYSEAAKKAEDKKKGIHSEVQATRRFWDLSKPDLRRKAKSEFSLENHTGLNAGVVENVIAATRFKLRFDQENCYFILSLNSVRGVPNNVNNKAEERWANEALDFAKSVASQRDIKFEIEQVDKNGVAHGNLYLGKENLAVQLLKRGLVFVEKGFRFSKSLDQYYEIQDQAKAAKKGIWGDLELNLDAVGLDQEDIPKGEVKQVVLSEFFGADDFFLQENGSEGFAKVDRALKKLGSATTQLKEPILIGTIALGVFEGELNRCKIIRKKKDEYEVDFIDYGNTASLRTSELKQCPNEVQKIPAQAFNARLDYIQVPPAKSPYAREANRYFEKLGPNAKLKCRVTRKEDGQIYCMLWPANAAEEIHRSINYKLVHDGVAVLGTNIDGANAKVWEEAGQSGVAKNPELISYMNNMDDY